MEEICRVCMAKSGLFTNIFEEPQKWYTCIADMIAECTGYVVRRGDSLPKSICPSCLEDAVSAFNLKKTCELSHKLYFTLKEKDRKEDICDNLEDEDWEPSDIGSEQSEHFEAGEEINQNDSNNIVNFVRPFKSPYCTKSFHQKTHLQVHSRSHAMELTYMCTHCSKSFSRSDSLRIHILRLHTDKRNYQCPYCSQSLQQKIYLREHKRTHTGERPFRCSSCSKSFKQKSKLDRHSLTHTGERPYQCAQCSKSFQEKSNLQVHLRSHTGERPFKCTHCSKTFRYKNSSYQRHILTHKSNDKCAIPAP